MITYKLHKNQYGVVDSVELIEQQISIPFDPDNTDYQNFKVQINNESAQLYDADGVLISAEEAKAYVATLP